MSFRSNRLEFNRKNNSFIEMVQQRMAMSIEVIIKTGGRTPVKTGGMKSEVRHYKYLGSFRVEAGKSYSSVQEAGRRLTGKGAPTAPFKNYHTPGTGPHWFQHAIDQTLKQRDGFIKEAARANNL